MILHLGFELPTPVNTTLDHEVPELTSEEKRILQSQIRKNSILIDEYIQRLDLLVNKERYPVQAVFLEKIRRRLVLLMEENDTFRKVLWSHYQKEDFLKKGREIS